MPKFYVGFHGYASYGVTVEAEDEHEAREVAALLGAPDLCAHCSGFWNADKEGTPTDISLGEDWEIDAVEAKDA